MAILLLTYL